jgi:hypothetical protein
MADPTGSGGTLGPEQLLASNSVRCAHLLWLWAETLRQSWAFGWSGNGPFDFSFPNSPEFMVVAALPVWPGGVALEDAQLRQTPAHAR